MRASIFSGRWSSVFVLALAYSAASILLLAGCGGTDETSSSVQVVSAPTTVTAITPAPTPTPTPSVSPVPGSVEQVTYNAVVVQAGDSIGNGNGATGNWAALDHLGLGSGVALHNVSAPGETLATGFGHSASEYFVYYDAARPSILLIQQGTNDLGSDGTSGASLYADSLTPFVAAAHAAGFYVIVDTLLPRADSHWSAAKEGQRVIYNNAVRANTASADAIDDLAIDPVLGDGVNPATSPYYDDALHPNLAGQQRLATLNAAALVPFLTLKPRPR